MKKIEKFLSREELTQKMADLAKGRGGLLIVPIDYWKMITEAYDSPLVRRVTDVSIPACPVTVVETGEIKFRVAIKPE